MSDNEHTTASLGHSEVLSVKNAVGEPIPELPQPSEQGSKRSGFVRQNAGDVFPQNPLGAIAVNDAKKCEGEVAPRVSKSFAKSRNAEGLAGGSPNENVDCVFFPFMVFGHVTVVWNVRPVVSPDGIWEWFNFA